MNTILKQFVEWGTSLRKSEFERATLRLTLYYALGVGVILLVSSGAIFFLVSSAFPTPEIQNETQDREVEIPHEEFSLLEFREHLIDTLVLVDISVLVIVTILAYFFARKTLRPIETLYRAQERFVADVAHELRTPLAVVKAGSETLLRKERTGEEYRIFIKETEEETNRLIRLSNELLVLLSQNHVQKKVFERMTLLECVRNQVAHFASYAEQAQVMLTCSGDVSAVMEGVSDSIVRMCQNLIKNAIDYTIPKGSVHVSVVAEKDKVILLVKDTGVGITPENQDKIFDRFYKVDSARTKGVYSGAGLGLAIVEDIVRSHQGQVSIESSVGVGTTVKVVFPKASS